VVDFHSLRHTFISNLCAGRVHPKTAQALARHSTINLTMDRYTHLTAANEATALDALPDLTAGDTREAVRATGTDGASVHELNTLENAHKNAHIRGGSERTSMDSSGLSEGRKGKAPNDRKGLETLRTVNVSKPIISGGPSRIRTCDQGIMSPPL